MKHLLHRWFPRLHDWRPFVWDHVSGRYVFETCSICDSVRMAR